MATIPSHWPRAVFGPRATLCKLCPSFRSSPHLPTSCRHRVSVCRSTETVLGAHLSGLVFSPSLGHIQANGKVRNTDKERTLAQSWAFIPWGLDQRISWGSSSAAGLEPVICKALCLRWGSTEASLGGKQARLSPPATCPDIPDGHQLSLGGVSLCAGSPRRPALLWSIAIFLAGTKGATLPAYWCLVANCLTGNIQPRHATLEEL